MDKRIEKNLELNTGITEEFEEFSRDCFERIFDMLGRKNFERWIDKRKLAPRIKNLVIESMEDKDKKEHPHWAGYYTRGKDRIRIGVKKKDVATHEKFHFMTDNGEGFPTFIDEGLTEYLTGMVEGKTTAYIENVATVKFLHKLLGDSIIKAYLLGAPNIFDNKVISVLAGNQPEKVPEIREKLEKFYRNLNIFHEYRSADDKYYYAKRSFDIDYSEEELEGMQKDLQDKKGKYEAVQEDIIMMFQDLAVGKISKMAENLEFYNNGILDVTLISKTISEVIREIPLSYFTNDFQTIGMVKQNISILATKAIVKNSHLAMIDDGEKIEEFVTQIMPNIEYSKTSITMLSPKMSSKDPILELDDSKILETVTAILPKEGMDITSFLEKLAILQERFNISDTQMDYILTKYNIDRFANSEYALKINDAIKSSFPMFRALYKLERKREEDTVSTRENIFRDIGPNRYIEVRDNQRFLLDIGENGKVYEEEIKYGRNIMFRGRERLDINYQSGMEDVEVTKNGKRIRPGVPTSFREIKDSVLGEAILKIVKEKVESDEYLNILDDAPNPYRFEGIRYTGEVDKRSRVIDWKKFTNDLQSIQEGIPESVRQYLFNTLAYSLLDRTFGVDRIADFDAMSLYHEITDNLERILDSKINEQERKKYLKRIEYSTVELNKMRIERVTESLKTAAISFETQEAQDKYLKYIKSEKKEEETEKNKDLQKRIATYDCSEFIIFGEKSEEPQYYLSGVYTTDDIDTRDRTINLNDFANSISQFLLEVSPDKENGVFEKIFSKMMMQAYGISRKDLKNDSKLNQAVSMIKTAISEKVFDEEDRIIDEDNLKPSMEILNNFHKEYAEANKAHAMITFKDENTRKLFDVISNLVKTGVTDGEIGGQIRTLIEIHNDMMKKKNSRDDKTQ